MKMKIEKPGHTVLGHTVARGFGLPASWGWARGVKGHVRRAHL
jgi:hypothetical protein